MALQKINAGASASPLAAVFLLFSPSTSRQVFFPASLHVSLSAYSLQRSSHQRPTKQVHPCSLLHAIILKRKPNKYRRRSAEFALAQNQAKEEAEVSLNQFYGSLAGASCSLYTLYKQMGTDSCQAISVAS